MFTHSLIIQATLLETSTYGNGTTQLGVDYSTYPLSRRYTLGVNVTF